MSYVIKDIQGLGFGRPFLLEKKSLGTPRARAYPRHARRNRRCIDQQQVGTHLSGAVGISQGQ